MTDTRIRRGKALEAVVGLCAWAEEHGFCEAGGLGFLVDAVKAEIAVNPELLAASRDVMKSYEAYAALGSEPRPDSPGSPPKPEDQWDIYDHMMIPAWRRLKAAVEAAIR